MFHVPAFAIINEPLAVTCSEKPIFGVIKNGYNVIVTKLPESIEYAKKVAK